MTTATTRTTPSLLSNTARAGIAVAAIALVGAAWLGAEHSSRHAVQEAQVAINRTYVTLPPVEVVAHREKPAQIAATTRRPNAL